VARRSASDERASLRETVSAPARWLLAVELPYVGTLVLSGVAILNVYGDGFRAGALWLALLSVAHGANIFAGLAETLLMFERPRLNLANTVVTAGVQAGAGLVLIPRFGITGAAVAMCLGFGVQSVMRFVQLRHIYGWWWPWSSLSRPVAAFATAFVPAALMRILSSGLLMEILSGVFFLALYFTLWWVIGPEPVDRELWARLRQSNWMRRRAG
jgi:O-antigen/teichoic acid export membrane protein